MSDQNEKPNDPSTTPEVPTGPVVDAGTSFDEKPGDVTITTGGNIKDKPEPRETGEDATLADPDVEATREPDHAQIAPESDPTDPSDPGDIYLPRLLSDEYGMSETNATVAIREGELTINGKLHTEHLRNGFFVPYEVVQGAQIMLRGPIRSVAFLYAG